MKSKLFYIILSAMVLTAAILFVYFNFFSSNKDTIREKNVQKEPIKVMAYPNELDFNKSMDVVFSLQKEDLQHVKNLSQSEIVLSGVFTGLKVTDIVSLEKTYEIRIKGELPIEHLYYEDNWLKDELGYIGIEDEDIDMVYIAEIDIKYDTLEVFPGEVEISKSNEYAFDISLNNGIFNKVIDVKDVLLKGSFKDFDILKIEMIDDSAFRISLKGETDGIGSGIIHLNNNVHESGLSMDVLVSLLEKPKLYTSEIIFNTHYSEEEIILHLSTSAFSKTITPKDIKVSGLFDNVIVKKVNYLDESNIELILTGKLKNSNENGIITIAKEGTDYNKDLQVSITKGNFKVIADPAVIVTPKDGQTSMYPILLKSYTLDFPSDLNEKDIALGGAISGMKVTDIQFINKKEVALVLSGSPVNEGAGTIEIGDSGLITVPITVNHIKYLVGRVYLNQAIENPKIEITNQAGVNINNTIKLIEGSDGTYFIEIDHPQDLEQHFRITAKGNLSVGNTIQNVTLSADVEKLDSDSTIIGINAITTLTSMYLDQHPDKTLKEAESIINRFLSLPESHNFNNLLVENTAYFSHEVFMEEVKNADINEYFMQLLADIETKEPLIFSKLTSAKPENENTSSNNLEFSNLVLSNNNILKTSSISLSSTGVKFDFSEIVGSAAKSVAGAAGSQAFNFALGALGVDTASSQLKEISTKLDELKQSMAAIADKQLAATYKSAFDIRMDTLNHDVNTINDLLTQIQALEKSTGSIDSLTAFKDDLLKKIDAANIPTMLADINSQLTGTSSLINLYHDYLKASLPFRHEVFPPMEELYTYCAAAQADGLYLYGVYCNQISDSDYLTNLYTDLKAKTITNIQNQATLMPKKDEGAILKDGAAIEVQPINNFNFIFPYTNDGTRWCIWGYVSAGSEWFDSDYNHYDNGTNWTRSERWYEAYYKVLDSWGYRPLTWDDKDMLTGQFLKGSTGNTQTFLSDHGINMSPFTRIYIEESGFDLNYINASTSAAESFSGFGRYPQAIDDAFINQTWMIVFRLR